MKEIRDDIDRFGVAEEFGHGRGNEAQIYKRDDGTFDVEVRRVFGDDWKELNEKAHFGGRLISPRKGKQYKTSKRVKTIEKAADFISENLWFDL